MATPESLVIDLPEEAATLAMGAALGKGIAAGAVLYLRGELGAGKTTLCRGLLRALGHAGNVKSPTYTLVVPYQLEGRHVHHFDLYRLSDPEELEYLGIRDYVQTGAVLLIEWPERGCGHLPAADLEIELSLHDGGRRASIRALTATGREIVAAAGSARV